MYRPVTAVVLLMQSAAPPADDPRAFTISPGRVIAGTLAVAGAIGVARLLSWCWVDVCRPLFDGFVVRALRRERANFEQYLRADIFEDDLNAGELRAEMAVEAHRIASACEESLRVIRGDMAENRRHLEPIANMAGTVDRIARSLEGVERTVGDMREEAGRQAGALEAMQQGAAWNGVNRREGGPK